MCLPLTRRERIVENRRKRVWIASNRERYNAYMRSYKAAGMLLMELIAIDALRS